MAAGPGRTEISISPESPGECFLSHTGTAGTAKMDDLRLDAQVRVSPWN